MSSSASYFPIQGHCDDRFAPVRAAFEANFQSGADIGASVVLIKDGETLVDLWGGAKDAAKTQPWDRETVVAVASTTKTATAICALMLADRGELDVDAPVSRYWPGFEANGKSGVLVRHCLGHTAGLPGWDADLVMEDLGDWEKCTGLLAAQAPWWEPGTASGYHGLTTGYLVGEVIRRITGESVGTFLARELTGPLDAQFLIGVKPEDDRFIGDSIPPAVPEVPAGGPDSMAMRIHDRPPIPRERWSEDIWRRIEVPAANGYANARGVARINALLSHGGESGGKRLLSPEGAERIFYRQSNGPDLVFFAPVQWGLGLALDLMGMDFDGHKVCFWGGSGGSLIVNDVDNRMTLAYVMNQLEASPFGDPRNAAILRAAYASLKG